jgi:hypothetical protein
VAGSADAAQALSGHMAGLNTFLAEHHTPVETLTLTSMQGGGTRLSGDQGTDRNMQQGAGQETAQGAEAGFQSGASPDRAMLSAAPSWSAGSMENATAGQVVGGHISVMA